MLLAQDLAGFEKGQADELRKGMGKKRRRSSISYGQLLNQVVRKIL